MAITTFGPNNRARDETADMDRQSPPEIRDDALEKMFGARLTDDPLDADSSDHEVEVAAPQQEPEEEHRIEDFTGHAFAAVHNTQEGLIASRGDGNVDQRAAFVSGDAKKREKEQENYRNSMFMAGILASTAAQDIALRKAIEQAEAYKSAVDEVAQAKTNFEVLEAAKEDAIARGDSPEVIAAWDEAQDRTAVEITQGQNNLQQQHADMQLNVDSLALEFAATSAAQDGMDEATILAAKQEITEARQAFIQSDPDYVKEFGAVNIDVDSLSPAARTLYESAQENSGQMMSGIVRARDTGVVELDGMSPDMAAATQEIAQPLATAYQQRMESSAKAGIEVAPMAQPLNDFLVCRAPDDVTLKAEERLARLDNSGQTIGQSTPTGDMTLTSTAFDPIGDSVTTAASLATDPNDPLIKENGFTTEKFSDALQQPGGIQIQPNPNMDPTLTTSNDRVQPGSMEEMMKKITDPTYSMTSAF